MKNYLIDLHPESRTLLLNKERAIYNISEIVTVDYKQTVFFWMGGVYKHQGFVLLYTSGNHGNNNFVV
jgi:hypothetical protein